MSNAKPGEAFSDVTRERYYDISQIAAMFPGRSRRWVEIRVKRGDFGAVLQVDKAWLVPITGIQDFVRKHTVEPAELKPDKLPPGLTAEEYKQELDQARTNLLQFRPPA